MLLLVHSPGGSTLLRKMTLWPPSWKCDEASAKRICGNARQFLICSTFVLVTSGTDLISLLILFWLRKPLFNLILKSLRLRHFKSDRGWNLTALFLNL